MSKWENLPTGLLIRIEEFLVLFADKVRFRSVCKSWKSALPRTPQLPWLLHPCQCQEEASESSSYGLFSLVDNKTYYLDLPIKTERVLLRGSSHGWMVSVEGPHDEIYLVNPLTRAKIQLPSRSKFPDIKGYCADNLDSEYSFWDHESGESYTLDSTNVRICLTDKFFISSNPSLTDDYMVLVIYGEGSRLAYCKPGNEKWTAFLGNIETCFSDVIFYKGKIHALIANGTVEVIDINLPDHPQSELIAAPPYPALATPLAQPEVTSSVPYIVESSCGLLLVELQRKISRTTDPKKEFTSKTLHFNVFKLDQLDDCPKWCKITDIGDEVLFIGFNTSVSRSSLEFPELKRNSIYFTDNLFTCHYEGVHGGSEMGIFDLTSQSMEPLPGYKCDSNLVWPPPIWLIPSTLY